MERLYHKEFLFRRATPPGSSKTCNNYGEYNESPSVFPCVGGKNRGLYSVNIYPNGEFGMGIIGRQRKKKAERDYDRSIVGDYKIIEEPTYEDPETKRKYYDPVDMNHKLIKLDSPSELSQRKKYGLKGITPYGKKMVRNGCYFIENKLCRSGEFPQFSTVTLPPMDEKSHKYICLNWSNIVKRFFQELRREYIRCARMFHYTAVTEIQPKRWERDRFVGLHLHFVYIATKNPKTKAWIITDDIVREVWNRILHNTLTHCYRAENSVPPLLPKAMYRREPVRKSAEAYLGKYMSKGGKILHEVLEEKGPEYIPSQWWSCSGFLKKMIIRATIKTESAEVVEYILSNIKNNAEEIKWWKVIAEEITYEITRKDNAPRIVTYGYTGKMSANLRNQCKVLSIINRIDLTTKK